MSTVELHGVRKSFGDLEVIHGVDLEVAHGEFVALVGPSGCGKSTLLRMVAGLEDVSGGDIRIAGASVNHLDPRSRGVAMVFQSYALYPHMTVAGNLSFSLRMRRAARDEIESKVAEAVRALRLDALLERYPRQLSGGQRQRVAMGRAMVRDPSVFLFDEPLSNLDANLRVQMRGEIKDLHRRLGSTALYVTHDQIEAMTMADRIAVMNGGIIEQVGTPLELYDAPVNLFVAGFIGSPAINLLRGVTAPNGEKTSVALGDGVALDCAPGNGRAPERRVLCGVRPEHFTLQVEGEGLPCRVTNVEPVGREILIYGSVAGQPVCVTPGWRPPVKVGEVIYLRPETGRLSIFDEQTGLRDVA